MTIFVFQNNFPGKFETGAIYITSRENKIQTFKNLGGYEKYGGEFSDDDIFIDRNVFSSVVSFQVNVLKSRNATFIKSNDSITDIINNKENYPSYNIASGDKMGPSEDSVPMFRDIKTNMLILVEILEQYMSSGYHKLRNNKQIEDWSLCFTQPCIKFVMFYYGIGTSSPDIPVVDQFLQTPTYRQLVSDVLMRVISNFVVNNNIIDITGIKSWSNDILWESIFQNMKDLEFGKSDYKPRVDVYLSDITNKDKKAIEYLTNNQKIMSNIRKGKIWSDRQLNNFMKYTQKEQKQGPDEREQFYWAIRYRKSEKNEILIGIIGFHPSTFDDKDSGALHVTIFINPHYSGKGIGKIALNSGLEKMKEYRKTQKYEAYILEKNIASIRLFESAGFERLTQAKMLGRRNYIVLKLNN